MLCRLPRLTRAALPVARAGATLARAFVRFGPPLLPPPPAELLLASFGPGRLLPPFGGGGADRGMMLATAEESAPPLIFAGVAIGAYRHALLSRWPATRRPTTAAAPPP